MGAGPKLSIGGKIARKACADFPKTPTKQIAEMLCRDHPKAFPTYQVARARVRHARGLMPGGSRKPTANPVAFSWNAGFGEMDFDGEQFTINIRKIVKGKVY